MSGKGSSPRPYSVSQDQFAENWDRIFRKPTPQQLQDAEAEDEAFALIKERNERTLDREVPPTQP